MENQEATLKSQTSTDIIGGHEAHEDLLKPLKFASLIVRRECSLCCGIFVLLILITFIDSFYFAASDNSNRAYLVEDDEYTISFDSFNLAAEFISENDNDTSGIPQTEKENFLTWHLMFKLRSYNTKLSTDHPSNTDYWILTPESIKTIIKYEDKFITDSEWKTRFCYVGDDPLSTNYSCIPNSDSYNYGISSVARYIVEYYDYDYGNMTTADIKTLVLDKIADPETAWWASHFNPHVNETGQTYLYRTFIFSGMPIANDKGYDGWDMDNETGTIVHESEYSSASDKFFEQMDDFVDWAEPYFQDLTIDPNGGLTEGKLEILPICWAVYNEYWTAALNNAFFYVIFSILVCLCYMTFHLSSVFLSSLAMFQILMSFPLAYFVYRLIFQIPQFDPLSSLIIFVLLGVGADDVFVFTDAWLQSVHFVEDSDDLVQRMTFAYRRASKAMLVTQMTTFFAFLATSTSRLMPISAFGIWAATIVAMNFILVITMYPCIIIIHHKYVKKWEYPCLCFCCHRYKENKKTRNLQPNTPEKDEKAVQMTVNGGDDGNDDNANAPPLVRAGSVEEMAEEYRWFEKFLGIKFSAFIVRFRRYILAMFLVLFCVGAWAASLMEAQSEPEQWFADEHFMQQGIVLSNEFQASDSDDLVTVQISWGIKGVNREDSSRWDPAKYGRVKWDNSFDMSSSAAQNFLLNVCNDLKKSSLSYDSESVTCVIEHFSQYLNASNETFPYISGNSNAFAKKFYEFLESAYGTTALSSSLAYAAYDSKEDTYSVKYIALQTYSTITWDGNDIEGNKERELWDKYVSEISNTNKGCPDGICKSVQHISFRWCWLVTQTQFVVSAVQGVLIAMPLAFLVLLVATRNWIVSLFALCNIIGIMLCEVGVMVANGWQFGVSECISVVIIIGFSVDYVVHLANAYLESTSENRHERLSFSLLTIGISVVSGAVTTFSAGFFLIFPEITFFGKMGILMMSTVALSLLWAFFFFTSLMAEWGPQGDVGNINKYFVICWAKVTGNYDANAMDTKNELDGSIQLGQISPSKETYNGFQGHEEHHKGYDIR